MMTDTSKAFEAKSHALGRIEAAFGRDINEELGRAGKRVAEWYEWQVSQGHYANVSTITLLKSTESLITAMRDLKAPDLKAVESIYRGLTRLCL